MTILGTELIVGSEQIMSIRKFGYSIFLRSGGTLQIKTLTRCE